MSCYVDFGPFFEEECNRVGAHGIGAIMGYQPKPTKPTEYEQLVEKILQAYPELTKAEAASVVVECTDLRPPTPPGRQAVFAVGPPRPPPTSMPSGGTRRRG